MKVKKNKTILFILVVITGLILFTVCISTVSDKKGKEVSYKTPEFLRDTNLGAELPFIAYESEHRIVFYHGLGLFVYDLDNSRMFRAIKISDRNIKLGAQGDDTAVVLVEPDNQMVTIYEVRRQPLDYYYVYDINADKLYQYPIGQLNIEPREPKVTGRMDTDDWSAWSLSYTSMLTGEKYYPLREIAK